VYPAVLGRVLVSNHPAPAAAVPQKQLYTLDIRIPARQFLAIPACPPAAAQVQSQSGFLTM
jgi:hypothetical protein